MNKVLIDNWNSVVEHGDLVYVLGDFCFRSKDSADYYLSNLNGSKILISGNHDSKSTLRAVGWKEVYKTILETIINDKYMVLCHYAMRTWNRSYHNSWHLFGHSHGKLGPMGKSFDIGVDSWNYFPVSFEKIVEKMATLESNYV